MLRNHALDLSTGSRRATARRRAFGQHPELAHFAAWLRTPLRPRRHVVRSRLLEEEALPGEPLSGVLTTALVEVDEEFVVRRRHTERAREEVGRRRERRIARPQNLAFERFLSLSLSRQDKREREREREREMNARAETRCAAFRRRDQRGRRRRGRCARCAAAQAIKPRIRRRRARRAKRRAGRRPARRICRRAGESGRECISRSFSPLRLFLSLSQERETRAPRARVRADT